MIASLLTALFFALSMVFASRSARVFGGAVANLGRMVIALILLGIWAHGFGTGLHGASLPWFVISGVVGFGFGDIALFFALTRLGPRLTALLAQCLAAPFGAILEYFTLGTVVHGPQLLCGGIILLGVAIAIAPGQDEGQTGGRTHPHATGADWWVGVLCGILAALGQAAGAVISRKAYEIAQASALVVDGGTAAYQRMMGGLVTAALFYAILYWFRSTPGLSPKPQVKKSGGWLWILLHASTGPTLGVGFYQWALSSTASGIVLPIVATTPVLTIPFAYLINKDKPTLRSIVGGIIAVLGTIALMRV